MIIPFNIDKIDLNIQLAMILNEEEFKAFQHCIPMTQKLFDSICEKCSGINPDITEIMQHFWLQYPDLLIENAKSLEAEIENTIYPILTEKETEQLWNNIIKKIQDQP